MSRIATGDGTNTASFVARHIGELKLSVFVNSVQVTKRPFIVVVHKSYLALDKQSTFTMSDGNMGKLWGVAVDSKGTWVIG